MFKLGIKTHSLSWTYSHPSPSLSPPLLIVWLFNACEILCHVVLRRITCELNFYWVYLSWDNGSKGVFTTVSIIAKLFPSVLFCCWGRSKGQDSEYWLNPFTYENNQEANPSKRQEMKSLPNRKRNTLIVTVGNAMHCDGRRSNW